MHCKDGNHPANASGGCGEGAFMIELTKSGYSKGTIIGRYPDWRGK